MSFRTFVMNAKPLGILFTIRENGKTRCVHVRSREGFLKNKIISDRFSSNSVVRCIW